VKNCLVEYIDSHCLLSGPRAICCRTLSSDELETMTPELLKQHRRPNTYILTKAVAEKLVEEQRGDIPCCVVRPTIVAGSYQEPVSV